MESSPFGCLTRSQGHPRTKHMKHLRFTILLLLVSGCDHNPPVPLTQGVDLRYEAPSEALPPLMKGVELKTHSDFDHVESVFKLWSQEAALLTAYEKMLETQPDHTLLAVRSSLLRLRLGGVSQMTSVIPMAEVLRKEHPDNPDVKLLLAESAFMLLPRGTAKNSFQLQLQGSRGDRGPGLTEGAGQPISVAQTALRLWKELMKVAPDYVGPHGLTTTEIKQRVDAVQTALQVSERKALERGLIKEKAPTVAVDANAPTRIRVMGAIQRGAEAKELCEIGMPLLEAKEKGELAKQVALACKASEEETH
jgi:hypothetical protein